MEGGGDVADLVGGVCRGERVEGLFVVGACGEPAFVLAEAGLVEGFAGRFELGGQEDQAHGGEVEVRFGEAFGADFGEEVELGVVEAGVGPPVDVFDLVVELLERGRVVLAGDGVVRELPGDQLVFRLRVIDEEDVDLVESGFYGGVAAVVAGQDEFPALFVLAGCRRRGGRW